MLLAGVSSRTNARSRRRKGRRIKINQKAACVTQGGRNLCVAKEEAASFWPVEAGNKADRRQSNEALANATGQK